MGKKPELFNWLTCFLAHLISSKRLIWKWNLLESMKKMNIAGMMDVLARSDGSRLNFKFRISFFTCTGSNIALKVRHCDRCLILQGVLSQANYCVGISTIFIMLLYCIKITTSDFSTQWVRFSRSAWCVAEKRVIFCIKGIDEYNFRAASYNFSFHRLKQNSPVI